MVALLAAQGARDRTSTTALAIQKLEALRSLTWGLAPGGLAVSDTFTDLSVDPATASGPGLGPGTGRHAGDEHSRLR